MNCKQLSGNQLACRTILQQLQRKTFKNLAVKKYLQKNDKYSNTILYNESTSLTLQQNKYY